ncbi:alpha/beta fold hydrolase [Candidatus Cyanaurora vandensis]|uniref:alpha/beta fold hydrolase n=1 Tax=Candidatus Cyanaurora vandensis TaxID=2714958 RepID=UPI00257BD191|nr:alpha/beta fold hydrolase [Candidatus Cyanaurora vandensis]
MRLTVHGWLLVLLTACTQPAPKPTIALTDCQLRAPGSSERLAAKCGKFRVAENRTTGLGRQIDLNLAVLPASSRAPQADPLFFIPGGPGEAATQSFLTLAPVFERINQDRDIVLVDQRGTGRSNPLTCATTDLKACLQKLSADPTQYTTSIAMADLEAVRAALGYEHINLYGGSYGTRAALTYLRTYPDRVRAVVLDGVVPLDWTLGLTVAQDAQRALDLIFTRCEQDPDCQKAFPQVRMEFTTLARQLAAQPRRLTVPHPVSGRLTPLTVDRAALVSTVRLFSYVPEAVALIPLLIHTAAQSGDLQTLAAQTLLIGGQVQDGISVGMFYSVVCAEDVPFYPVGTPPVQSKSYFQEFGAQSLAVGCRDWPRGQVSPDFKKPVTSRTPVLLLSGEVDPVPPPANGTQASRTLANSLHIVAPGQGHIVISRGCIPKIVTRFISQGQVKDLETACVKDLRAVPFFLDKAGPAP